MSSIAGNLTGRGRSAKVDAGKEVIYPGTIVWNALAMGEHQITDVQPTSFLFRITGPALTEEQVCELSRRAMPYHLRRKEEARAQIAKQVQEEKAEETRKKAEYRRLHRKTYVKATVNACLKRQFKEYHERQQAIHGPGEEWDVEDDTNIVVGERDDEYID